MVEGYTDLVRDTRVSVKEDYFGTGVRPIGSWEAFCCRDKNACGIVLLESQETLERMHR